MILKTALSVSQSSLGIQINMKTFTLGAENFANFANFGYFRESLGRKKFCFGPFAKIYTRETFPDFPFFLIFFLSFLDQLFPTKSSLVLA